MKRACQLVLMAGPRALGRQGRHANVGVIAYDPAHYELLVEQLTAERVKAHFGPSGAGEVERFELPNLHALNFLLHHALGRRRHALAANDAQGKVLSTALLRMEIEVPDDVARRWRGGDACRRAGAPAVTARA
jgi:hypothetical protein